MLIFWALIAFVLVFLVQEFTDSGEKEPSTRPSGTGGDALRILNERFAEGKIDEEEYRRRKKEITA